MPGTDQGKAVALAYASEGARVVALDVDEAALDALPREVDGERIFTAKCDVSDEAQVRGAISFAVDRGC